MSTARESALPVVNLGVVGTISHTTGLIYIDGINDGNELTEQPVPLPGWALEKEPLWDDYRKRPSAQNVYRLVRSEPVKP